VSEAWVANVSPVILFARIGRLNLFEGLAPTCLIPNGVLEKVRGGQEKDRTAAAASKWAEKYHVGTIPVLASIEHWSLGAW
jgi:hypothetical protein